MTRCDCGGRYRLVAEIHSAEVAAGILRWLALQDAPLAITPARPPPDPDPDDDIDRVDDEPDEDPKQTEFNWAP